MYRKSNHKHATCCKRRVWAKGGDNCGFKDEGGKLVGLGCRQQRKHIAIHKDITNQLISQLYSLQLGLAFLRAIPCLPKAVKMSHNRHSFTEMDDDQFTYFTGPNTETFNTLVDLFMPYLYLM